MKRNRRLLLLSCIVFFAIVGFIHDYRVQETWGVDNQYDEIMPITLKSSRNGSMQQYAACPIPQLDPFDKSIEHFLDKGPILECDDKKYPLLFNSTLQSTIIPLNETAFVQGKYESCCYRIVKRFDKARRPDERERTSRTCFPLSFKSPTKIPEEHEFIGIFCRRYRTKTLGAVDVHAFVHLKPSKWEQGLSSRKDKLNVIMFGLDATSRMNFIRTMPQSYAFLKEEMGGVEMLGYNKVGENTLPNVMAMLTSHKLDELSCTSEDGSLNDCPFIWNEYSKQGYYTSFAEDAPGMAIFNMGRKGFSRPPTDYYLRPLSHWANENVASGSLINAHACFGPRLTFQYLLDYMQKFVDKMSRNRKNFFQFTFSTALSHDYQSTAHYGDAPLLNSLKWLMHSGHLNNTVLILMSDHGSRVGSFRQTIQGQLEDRLPVLFLVLPDSFKKKYQTAYQNLFTNRDKLVTPFDIHATLQDILNPENIQDASLQRRELLMNLTERSSPLPRQLSLFTPIPESRTCEMAGINMNFCSCTFLKRTSLRNPALKRVARVGVSYINFILADESRCAQLELKNVTMAQHTGQSSIEWEAYLINFETEPGGGQFEAMIGRTKTHNYWSVQDAIIRTNWYRNQSRCVNDYTLKSYCYCLD